MPGTTIAVLNPVPAVMESLGLPEDVAFVPPRKAQLVFLFFRKGSKTARLDMNRDDVWAIADPLGMSPLGLVSIDETWSVFRLKPAK